MKQRARQLASGALLALLAAATLLAAVVFRHEIWALITSQAARDEFVEWVRSHGLAGMLVFLGLEIFQIVVAVVPGEPVQLMAGALYGPAGGLALCLVGILIGSTMIYFFVRALGAKAIDPAVLHKYRFLQDEKRARSALYLLFFLPGMPKDLLTYLGPFLPLKPGEFLLICTLARFPCLLASTVAGDSLFEGNIALPLVLLAVTGALGLVGIRNEEKIMDWLRRRKDELTSR
ncbi:MAG TPA: VTT domain-containing protein [Candidatus Fournierella merdigallinarum]|nr:VTT domain-containing protein [Candidatus Fournierella merdigallinarum]